VNSRELAVIAAEAASDKKADDIIAINIAELLVVTDYFVIATGNTNIQVKAIAGEIEDQLRERAGVKPIGREGETEAKWVLLDYGDIVVHVFQPEERGSYRLEKLWGDAPRLALPASVVGRAPLVTTDPASADLRAEESPEDEQA